MAKWKQMKMIVGSIMVGALLMPTMSITAWANAETEVTVDNFESEILPNLAIKEDGTPLKVAITVLLVMIVLLQVKMKDFHVIMHC